MKLNRILIPMFLLAGLSIPLAFAADGDAKTTLSGVHICCGSCVAGVKTATTPVKGLTAVASQADGTIVLTAADKDTVQKGIDALTAAGYFGKSSDATYKVNADTGAKDGKVKTVTVEGVHLCCNSCVTAMKGVVAKVAGITDSDIKSKATSITVTGDFEPKTLATEMQKAGLTGKVKQ